LSTIDTPTESSPAAPQRKLFGDQKSSRAIAAVAAAWSLFQLSLPFVLKLNSDMIRTIHLCFAMGLCFLCFPAAKRIEFKGIWSFLSTRKRSHPTDWILAAAAAVAAGYFAFDYVGIASRQGMPIARDYVLGGLLLLFLLEATRRALGPALPCVAVVFIGIAFLGPELPSFISFKRATPGQVLGQLTMSTEGIYGIPLYVSATTVYLFVLFGAMLEKSGGGRYFVGLAFSLVGRYRGGPAKAAVLASGLTGLVSGSSIANTVTTGTFTIPLMIRAGYPPEKAAAVEVAASTNGQLMPPIMGAAAFIIAERCSVPYLDVVRAAFIPAVVSYLALIYITHLEACKLGLQGIPRADLPQFRRTLLKGAHFLLPLALLVTLLFLRFSAELAAFWAIIVLTALIVVRDLVNARRRGNPLKTGLKQSADTLWASVVAGGRNMMGISVAVAAAGIIVGVMTLGPGSLVTEVIGVLSCGNLMLMLLLAAMISLVLGMGLPTTANYIVMSTVTAPAILVLAGQHGLVVPTIAAHLFCFFFGILADDTPPVGLAAYAAAAIAKSDPIRTGIQGFIYDLRTAILPFMFIFNTELLLIGVRSWWHAVLVFVTAVVAMFAFAALTQHFLLVRNRIHESLLLGVTTLIMLRPGLWQDWTGTGSRFVWYGIGFALYGMVILMQLLRRRKDGSHPIATTAAVKG